MYKCPNHGVLFGRWCKDCNEIYDCDCSTLIESRFKDLEIQGEDDTRTVTIYIEHCSVCAKPTDIRLK